MCPESGPDAGDVGSYLQYFATEGFVVLVSCVWQHVVPQDSFSPLLGELNFNFVLCLFCSC